MISVIPKMYLNFMINLLYWILVNFLLVFISDTPTKNKRLFRLLVFALDSLLQEVGRMFGLLILVSDKRIKKATCPIGTC